MKMKKQTKKMILLAVCAVLAASLLLLVVQGVRRLFYKKADTSAGLEYIKQEENGNIAEIEEKISALEKKDSEGQEDVRSFKEKFTGAVVVGDSITQGFLDYDILNASSVVAKIGVHLTQLDEQIKQVKELSPSIIFLSLGMNDVTSTNGNTEQFVKQYTAVLEKLKKEVPEAHIFVNSIFPVQEKAIKEEPPLAKIAEYNAALKKLCDKKRIGYIDNTDLVTEASYEQDGVHFKASFYPIWTEQMAEVAGL